jgi:hypothetical protein
VARRTRSYLRRGPFSGGQDFDQQHDDKRKHDCARDQCGDGNNVYNRHASTPNRDVSAINKVLDLTNNPSGFRITFGLIFDAPSLRVACELCNAYSLS